MTKFGLAQSVRRVEDPRLLTGNGRYKDFAADSKATARNRPQNS